MKNKQRRKQAEKVSKREYAVFIAALLILFAVPVIMLGIMTGNPSSRDSNSDMDFDQETVSESDSHSEAEETPDAEYIPETITIEQPTEFPLLLEDGKLEIASIFRYDGINPDCSNQQGTDITAIEVRNLSGEHLKNAVITMSSDDAGMLHFTISELPAGKTAMVFSTENTVSDDTTAFGDVHCEALFETNASLEKENISVSVDGAHITLTNQTENEINEIVVYCRSALDDRYFGGVAYSYTVNNIPAHGTAELDAVDCLLGLAEVVRVEITKP